MKILVTGGCGYIGSHACLALLQRGHEVVVLDSLVNSSPIALERVKALSGKRLELIIGDIRNQKLVEKILGEQDISVVFHFAGLKSVSESVQKPVDYYDVNTSGTVALCQALVRSRVNILVFSSSCTVYGDPKKVPVTESCEELRPVNPYGKSKLFSENILKDFCASNSELKVAILRYFNPVGAHASGSVGENPIGTPNNLFPLLTQVAIGQRNELRIFGNNYDTEDGTGVRDYIHVMDLVEGHLAALARIIQESGCKTWNLGTGKGYSVLEVIKSFETAIGKKIPYRIYPRREGDIACNYADVKKATDELSWRAGRNLDEMVRDSWNWQKKNPLGY